MVASPSASSADVTKEVVRRGWDQVSTIYRPPASTLDAFGHSFLDYDDWLQPLIQHLPRNSAVLDLGCGCGVPVARELSQHFQVTGVDISDVQINRARLLVPNARFLPADMTRIQFPSQVFAGITCLYALIHVPLAEQRSLLGRVFDWLVPGGLVLLTTGETAWTGTEENWLGSGAPMYWSHGDAGSYEQWLREIGFEILDRRTIPEGASAHALFLAKRPGT
ncbi:MAG: class I SAM-dependent methyltransferase [Thermoplasmata archaeon]|nr:class I SAM-dependent methyltransferase [Thermoplasmata archaeon]